MKEVEIRRGEWVAPEAGKVRWFGTLRKLRSDRYQIRYPARTGQMRPGSVTYERKGDAGRALVLIEADLPSGTWTDSERGKARLDDYSVDPITQRPGLRPRTVDLYRWLLRKHIAPYIGGVPVGKVTAPLVRKWRAKLLADVVSVSMAAKAYRLLRTVMTTAVDDGALTKNPCRIRGTADEHAAERPVLTGFLAHRPIGPTHVDIKKRRAWNDMSQCSCVTCMAHRSQRAIQGIGSNT